MTQITFTIEGNHKNANGNPLPYKRTTQKQKWVDEGYKEYLRWKSFVQKVYCDSLTGIEKVKAENNLVKFGKPIVIEKGQIAVMDLQIYWKDRTGGDPDNIFKGISDALFVNDKHVYGSFPPQEGMYEKKKGRVLVEIKIT